jgi:hypothetical protein
MKDEVEEFLRRVAKMRAEAEAQGKNQPQRPPQKLPQKQPQQPTPAQPRLTPRPTPTIAQPLEAEVVDTELAERSDRVSRQVSADMRGTQEISEQTRRLGQEVDLADEKLEAHLHQVFDHQLGRLKKTASDTAGQPISQTPADMTVEDVRRLLLSPTSLRDAIIMAEVLRRPEW